jgi:hypothetical protein
MLVGYESEERDKAQKQLANAFWEIATEKFDSLVRVARLAVEQDAAGSLPKPRAPLACYAYAVHVLTDAVRLQAHS